MNTPTQWDDDRLVLQVVTRGTKSAITGLDEVGFVVTIGDAGPPDGRTNRPRCLFDSEAVHGEAGRFHDEETAREFGQRRLAGMLRQAREIEAERHRRKEALADRQADLWAEEHRQKEIAKAANKAAKEAEQLARKLSEEAQEPVIALSCNPSEPGWSLWVAPCWTDGTQDGDPRQLVMEGMGLTGPRKLADDSEEPKARKRAGKDPAVDRAQYDEAKPTGKPRRMPPRRKDPESSAKLPEHVPDAQGLPLRVGSRVECPDGDGALYFATVLRIVRQDQSGGYIVECEDDCGVPVERLSMELIKQEGRDPAEDEPEPDDE
jgi:hypothetical protein